MIVSIASIVIALIALLHVYILVLEIFLWEKPAGLRAFRNTPEKAAATRVLAANQGLYNGFLAAGLFWGLWMGATGISVQYFFFDLYCRSWCFWSSDCCEKNSLHPDCASFTGHYFIMAGAVTMGTEKLRKKDAFVLHTLAPFLPG